MERTSTFAQSLVGLLYAQDPAKGDLSYRLEGICDAISAVADIFSDEDRRVIADAIQKAFSRFGQPAKENRFAKRALEHLRTV